MTDQKFLNEIGVLWWIADSSKEAQDWVAELTAKGCTILRIDPHGADSREVDVVFSVDKMNAKAILGFLPEDENWISWEQAKNK